MNVKLLSRILTSGIFVIAEMGLFCMIFHYGENFVHDKHMFYRGGSETIVEGRDSNKWSFFRGS